MVSGIRYDLLLSDKKWCGRYLQELIEYHVSGQMKVAPEHTESSVLNKMGKPRATLLLRFKKLFDRISRGIGREQFLTYYLIAAHPGCTDDDMKRLKRFTRDMLKMSPEQVQIFLPTPSTYSSLMYYTETDPFIGKSIPVEKDPKNKEHQKNIVVRNS